MNIRTLFVSFMVFALFIIGLVSFGINFGNENNADIIITDNNSAVSRIYTGVNNTVHTYQDKGLQEEGTNLSSSFFDEGGTSGLLGGITDFFISSLLAVGKGIAGISNAIFNVTFAPLLKGLGIPLEIARVIGGILSTIMLFTMILLAWKLYRAGE